MDGAPFCLLDMTGLLIFRGEKSKISRGFQGQIRGNISRFCGILAGKSQISKDFRGKFFEKSADFTGNFGGNFAKKQSVKNSRFR